MSDKPESALIRLQELKRLRPGWLNGEGVPPDHDGLDRLAALYAEHYPEDLLEPLVFPTPLGCVQFEWPGHVSGIEVGIDLATMKADALWCGDIVEFNLDNGVGWWVLAMLVRMMEHCPPLACLRRLLAHVDESDPTRQPGRRAGTTISPYACDFEMDAEAMQADVKCIREWMEGMA